MTNVFTMKDIYYNKDLLLKMFRQWAGSEAVTINELPLSGSYRRYFRIKSLNVSAIGVFNPDANENNAFVTFTKALKKANLPVPQILAEDLPHNCYLLSDLGDTTLFSFLQKERNKFLISDHAIRIYKKVISYLPEFQINAGKNIDYSVCYPRAWFDAQSMMWDLNYFKYYFLKLVRIQYDEQELEDDFKTLINFLTSENSDYFMYRDFQSRNIMIFNDEPYFIDYQGGRRGALQYDIASLLWDAKADLPQKLRNELFEYYIECVSKYINVDNEKFTRNYYAFVYMRIFQALGAYGFRGLYERKEHFLLSIPYALKNLKWLMTNAPMPVDVPVLSNCIAQLVKKDFHYADTSDSEKLTVRLFSFSYKNGIPYDLSGNGGGFVFDCRCLPNPGRLQEYKHLTGFDVEVVNFLENEPIVNEFFTNTAALVSDAVENYIKRQFTNIMISFGCTGGQHRSVYFAERLKHYLEEKYDVIIAVKHREIK